MEKYEYAPSAEDFIKMLKESLEYCLEADDQGSIDGCMDGWQREIAKWPTIAHPEGGI